MPEKLWLVPALSDNVISNIFWAPVPTYELFQGPKNYSVEFNILQVVNFDVDNRLRDENNTLNQEE